EGNEVSVSMLVEPVSAHDEFVAKIANMRDRSAEGTQAQPGESLENFDGRSRPILGFGTLCASGRLTHSGPRGLKRCAHQRRIARGLQRTTRREKHQDRHP